MKLDEFINLYQEKRNSCLDKSQFASMLSMYPAALVAMADGEFGELEKLNLVSAIKVVTREEPMAMCEMYADMCYLIQADKGLQDAALACIKDEITGKDDLKNLILMIMQSTAESEDEISAAEQTKINELKTKLAL